MTTCRISVEISQRIYDYVRLHLSDPERKTSRVLSRYLATFFAILREGEDTLFRKLTPAELSMTVAAIHESQRNDRVPWDELCRFPASNLSAIVELYGKPRKPTLTKLAGLTAFEVLSLVEYAHMKEYPAPAPRHPVEF